MTTPMRFTLQIGPFCNCKGCRKKVKEALGKLDDVKLLEMDPEMGKLIFLTTAHPDAIKDAINDLFPKRKIILSHEINHSLHNQGFNGVHLQDAPPLPQPQQQLAHKVQTSTATLMTIALQIDPFCNCKGCMKKVKKAVGDVKLLEMDPEMGKLIFLTTSHPDAIKDAFKSQFSKRKIICVRLQDAPMPEINISPSAPPIPEFQIWHDGILQGTVSGFFENEVKGGNEAVSNEQFQMRKKKSLMHKESQEGTWYSAEYYPPDLVYRYPTE
ncbi:hypothetical protein L1987_35964 [Smallanthus sonchifolius]|uniref:Uncharacterized protein n=1 Tax=Smallanthus sonchifolius TaxID=185202 RepID=A0ACB9HEK6_9ASTR|nr:hypothetical protein L1987_35964 [Smallanthus sonchifolius]